MDAGERSEAEPRQDRVLRVGGPNVSGLGNSLSFQGVTLTTKNLFHILGVHLDPVLTMETQVAPVIRTSYFHLRWIAQLCSYLYVGALTTLVHALIVLRLDYCNALCVGLHLRLMQKVQMVQNVGPDFLLG